MASHILNYYPSLFNGCSLGAMDHTNETRNEPIDLDEILPQLGEFGRYQKLLLWFVCLPACIPCGFCAFNQLFMADVPDYWCKIPQLNNLTQNERKRIGIPFDQSFSKCERFVVNWSQVLDNFTDFEPNNSWPVEPCKDGWEYDTSEVTSSIVIDFDLVCDKDIYPTLGLTALNVGGPIGVYFFGLLNDRLGRKKSFFACLFTLLFGSVLTACSTGFWWWAFSRAIVGLTLPAIYQIPFIISLELVGPNYRSFVTVMTCTFYTFGLMALAGITYLIRDWVYLTLVTSLPFLLYLIYWFFLPESPRWLLAKGKFEEALKVLEELARVNGQELPPSFRQQIKQKVMLPRTVSQENEANPSVFSLCKTPNMRLKTILITLNWFANTTVYIGLSYYGPALGSNQYLSFLLSSAVEIPSYVICWFVMDSWGRRWPLCLCMIISGVTCIATMLLPPDAVTETLILYLISKCAISASFLIIYPFAGELYPTQLRGIGIGTSAYIGGLGLIIIPFITYLGSENLILPLIIMGVVSIIGGLLGLRLPETLHYRLPQTLEEGEEFGKSFTIQDWCRCVPLKPQSSEMDLYENLELEAMREEALSEITPLEKRHSMRRLARQNSFMDTQKDYDGTIKMTYWI